MSEPRVVSWSTCSFPLTCSWVYPSSAMTTSFLHSKGWWNVCCKFVFLISDNNQLMKPISGSPAHVSRCGGSYFYGSWFIRSRTCNCSDWCIHSQGSVEWISRVLSSESNTNVTDICILLQDDIGISGVIGSAVFNIMFVISVCALFSGGVIYLNWWPLVRDCIAYFVAIFALLFTIYNEVVTW